MDIPQFPMRINKYLAWKKYVTRRSADVLIKQGTVTINGNIAALGDKVNERDTVAVKGIPKNYAYYAFYKPTGIVTHSPQKGEEDIRMRVPFKGVFPLGRLDKESTGLIILTNDGHITESLLSPKQGHEKEYIVRTAQKLGESFRRKMETGVNIGDHITKKCKVMLKGSSLFSIVISEGKHHQIRRMCAALRHDVINLKRVRIMNIKLGNLLPGEYREIKGEELKTFLGELGF